MAAGGRAGPDAIPGCEGPCEERASGAGRAAGRRAAGVRCGLRARQACGRAAGAPAPVPKRAAGAPASGYGRPRRIVVFASAPAPNLPGQMHTRHLPGHRPGRARDKSQAQVKSLHNSAVVNRDAYFERPADDAPALRTEPCELLLPSIGAPPCNRIPGTQGGWPQSRGAHPPPTSSAAPLRHAMPASCRIGQPPMEYTPPPAKVNRFRLKT